MLKISYVTPPTEHGEKMLLIQGAKTARAARNEAARLDASPDTIQQYQDSGAGICGYAFRIKAVTSC